MDLFMVLKVCKQCYRVVVMNLTAKQKGRLCKNICVTGNLPELYTHMTLELEVRNTVVTDYKMELTEKNIKILQKNDVDVETYEKALSVHQELKADNYDWFVYKYESYQLYKKLPFKKADKLHKAIIGKAADDARIDAINSIIISKTRNLHTAEYQISDYIGLFLEV